MKKELISTLLLIAMVFQMSLPMGKALTVEAATTENTESSETAKTTETAEKEEETEETIEAENITIDGRLYEYVKYVINTANNTIRIEAMKTKETQLIIPAKIEGIPVTEVGAEKKIYTMEDTPLSWNIDDTQILEKVIVSEGVKKIVAYGFDYLKAKYVELPKSLQIIGADSWGEGFNNAEINIVKIKGKKTTMGACAFQSSKVKKIILPSKYQGEIYDFAFANSTLEEFKWTSGKGIIEIPQAAFENCKKLKKVVFPKNQKHIKISLGCFYGCKKLKKLTFPASTKKVTYLWTPHADNYKKSVNVLEFKGKKTKVVGIKNLKKKSVMTVGKIIAPKNSKALKYAKKAKRVKYLAEYIQKEIEGDLSSTTDFAKGSYGYNAIKYAKMKYSILKKK